MNSSPSRAGCKDNASSDQPSTDIGKRADSSQQTTDLVDAATRFVEVVRVAHCVDSELEAQLKAIIDACGWSRQFFDIVHAKLLKLLETNAEVGSAMENAIKESTASIFEYEKRMEKNGKHVEVSTPWIATGVEARLMPWFLEFLATLPDAQWSVSRQSTF